MRGAVRTHGCLLALVLFCSGGAPAAENDPKGGPVPLVLRAGSFDPRADVPDYPEHLALDARSASRHGVRIVQFERTPDAAVRSAVAAAGGRVLGYVPRRALVVRAGPETLAALRRDARVRWEGAVQPAMKLSPDLGTRPFVEGWRRAGGRLLVTVDLWRDGDPRAVAARLRDLGLDVRAVWTDDGPRRVLARGTLAQIERASRLEDVAWIEEHPEPVLRNDAASWVVQSNVADFRPVWDRGLHGEGQILGNIDSPLDMDSCYFDDSGAQPGPDHRKVLAYRSSSGQGSSQHGTHTNGTMAGDRGAYGVWDSGDGHAFAAKIVFSNLNDIDGSGTNPSNLAEFLGEAHRLGARVHANSWGDDGTTAYTTWSRDIDDFSWRNEDSLVVFAVTNGGSLRTPENAKNVLAAGATQREQNAGNHCSGGAGPTSDGRRKPEVYAPGCSTVSAANNQVCDTVALTGTSMACPAITGAAALVRQYFLEGWHPLGVPDPENAFTPTGALVKAVLVSGAEDMTGVAGYPSDREGWGRVNLDRSLFFDGDSRRLVVLDDVRRTEGFETGEAFSYELVVDDPAEPLRIALAFTEPPAELLAAEATVNDLDLEVEAPDGTTYWGNNTDGNGASVAGGDPDPRNNLELVLFPSPATGTYRITVAGAAVPVGPQGFALVATGGASEVPGPKLRHSAHRVVDDPPLGGADGRLDPGETARVPITLANRGSLDATSVAGVVRATAPDLVRVTRGDASWPDLPRDGSAESLAPHVELTVSPDAPCGQRLSFTVSADSDQSDPQESRFSVELGDPDRDYAGAPLDLPQWFFGTRDSEVSIADDVVVTEVDVSVDLSHGDVGEVLMAVVSPAGTQVILHNRSRQGEADIKTRYDRDREPDGPGSLDDFVGEGAAGTWTLAISDNANTPVPAGRLDSWTLHLTADRALDCTPLDCADPVPDEASGLTVDRIDEDLVFRWQAVEGASGYHLLESSSPTLEDADLAGRTEGATEITLEGAALGEEPRFYRVRAINSCGWEGP